uniref:Uncharacterized protein n=1 Tax=Avena sativa TaxID=4498 RepID=A0ACD6AMY9_AVESA
MAGFVGVVVSDPSLQGQFTQVELRSFKAKFLSLKRDSGGHVTTKNLPGMMKKLRGLNEVVSEDDIAAFLSEVYPDPDQEIEFESFLREYLNLLSRVSSDDGASGSRSTPSSFLKSSTTTLIHNPNQAEKSSYVAHINAYLGDDPFLKKYLPIDPAGDDLFNLVKDGVVLCKLINLAVPGTIDERAINKKRILNPWERNENHTLCLNSAKAIGCTVVNLGAQDLVEGRPHLVLGLISQIIKIKLTQSASRDDVILSRDERAFRMWINSLGVATYVNNVFEDVRNGWVLLEVFDKVYPGSVNWKLATKPPIKMPFRKLENCNQVINIGKQLKFSLVNLAGNDIVQGNKKLIVALLWQLMRFDILQLLNKLRFHSQGSQGKEITDADILSWANSKVKASRRNSRIESFKDKNISSGIFFLELLSAVQPRVVNWKVVSKGVDDDEKKLNATYIISIARKLGCSVFLLPDDIIEVNQKMILTLTASIMYWSLQKPQQPETSEQPEPSCEASDAASDIASEDSTSLVAPSEEEEVNSWPDKSVQHANGSSIG